MGRKRVCIKDVCVDQLYVLTSPGLAAVQQMGRPTGLQCFSTPLSPKWPTMCQVKHKTDLLDRCGLAITAFTAIWVSQCPSKTGVLGWNTKNAVILFMPLPSTTAGERHCVFKLSVWPSVVHPLTPILHEVTSLYLVEQFQSNLPQIFIIWVDNAERFQGQMSRLQQHQMHFSSRGIHLDGVGSGHAC